MERLRGLTLCGPSAALLLLLLAAGCGGEAGGPASADAPAAEPSPLDELAWIAGYWTGEKGGARIEELWMRPRSTTMLGLHRDVLPDGEVVFEYLRIEDTGDGAVYWASPMGGPPTPFRLVDSGAEHAVFQNETHDFPQRIVYWKDGGSLRARIEGRVGDEDRSLEWTFRPEAFAGSPRGPRGVDGRSGDRPDDRDEG